MSGVREDVYTTFVRLQLEYAAAIWDPNYDNEIKQIEKVQRRAARCTTCNFGRTASVTDMIETLGWRTLKQRHSDARLCLFFKIINNMVALPLPDYIQPNPRISRRDHSRSFCQLQMTKDYYKYSFFTRLQLFSGMHSQKKLLARRQALTYSRQQLASCNTQSPRSQV